jgi:hypothetical protein
MDTSTTEKRDLEHQIRRTLVPAIVAVLLGRLARAGLDIPADALAGIVEAVIFGIYYVGLSLVERYVPWAGMFLGAIGKPTYPDPVASEDRGEDDADV